MTPTSLSEDEGFPKKFEAANPSALAESPVFIQQTLLSGFSGRISQITAEAPDVTAALIKS
ncbi:MAG: hypothetical protein NTZ85_00285 [Bacteroidia bacterium]|nr:hypothetical protein [Bacteroidia bacterium]